MNKKQWYVFGIGFLIFGAFLFKSASPWCDAMTLENELLIACFIRRYAYAIPAMITMVLGWIFLICGGLEKK